MSHSSAQVRPIRLGVGLERRQQPRVYLPVSIRVSSSNAVSDSRLAYMRDTNIRGAFFFCDLQVTVGETLYVHLAPELARSKLAVNCEASVVRVEKPALNGLTGIAVEFHRFEAEDPTRAPVPLTSNWNLERFDRMFSHRLELEPCALRTHGAA